MLAALRTDTFLAIALDVLLYVTVCVLICAVVIEAVGNTLNDKDRGARKPELKGGSLRLAPRYSLVSSWPQPLKSTRCPPFCVRMLPQ